MTIDLKNIQITQRMMLGAIAAIGVCACLMFGYAAWGWYQDWVIAHQPVKATVSSIDDTQALIASIPDAHLFGQSFRDGDVPISSLQLQVTGIVKMDDETSGRSSKVYISIQGQPSKIYEKGDDLPYGVKVYDIAPDTVILQNNGKLEKLPLARPKLEFKPFQPKESM